MSQTEAVQLMMERAAAAHTHITEIPGLEEAFRYAVSLTKKKGGSSIAAPGFSKNELMAFERMCAENDLKLLRKDFRGLSGRITTGFTMGDWGIAETGTLVLDSTSEDLRLATMFSDVHVAVLRKSCVMADSMALERELSRKLKAAPRYIAFISGASRTGDIERVITLGVHGPGELHILLMEEARS